MKWYSSNGAKKNVLRSKEMRDKKKLVGNFFLIFIVDVFYMLISTGDVWATEKVKKSIKEIEASCFFKPIQFIANKPAQQYSNDKSTHTHDIHI